MNRRSTPLSLLVVILLFSSTLGNIRKVAAESPVRKVGIKIDDWARYGKFTVTWSSNDPDARPDQELIDANQTAWVHISVYDITQMYVSYQETTHFTNGTDKSASKGVDVDSGWGDGVPTFVSADLIKGDSIYSKEGALLKINETTTRTYVDTLRETNALNLTRSSITQGVLPQHIDASVIYFWDRATGILVERQASAINRTGTHITSWSRSDEIIATNLWGDTQVVNGEPPYWIVGVLISISIVIGGLGLWLRRRSRFRSRKRRSYRR